MLAVVVATTALSACSSATGGGNALVVNGATLTNKQFQTFLNDIQGDADYVKAALSTQQGQAITTTGDANSFSTAFTTQVLNQQVTFALASQEVAKRGLTVSADDKARAQQVLASNLSPTDPTTGQPAADGSGQKTLDDLGSFKNPLIDGVANILAIQNDITAKLSTDEALQKAYDAGKDTYKNQACTSVIIIDGRSKDPATGKAGAPTDATSAAALAKAKGLSAQVTSPETFASVAQASSDDQTTGAKGGDIGCAPVGAYAQSQPEIDAAIQAQPVGQVGAPVKASFGYALVLVRSRGDLTFEQAKPQLTAGISTAMKAAFQDWLTQAGKDASVSVDPQWGTWDKDNATVIAPEGATSTTTTADPNAPTSTPLSPEQLQQLLGSAGASGGAGTSTPTSAP